MKSLLLILLALTCLTLPAKKPRPTCQCPEYGTPVCAAYWKSDAVFVGQLRDITPRSQSGPPTAMLHFIVEQPFRGITSATVDIETLSGTTCDIQFVKGGRYLVYAHRDLQSAHLSTHVCSGTTELEFADEDLNYIRSVTQQGVTESIGGRISRMKYEGMAGVKIQVRNEDKSFETTTDKDGNYSISLAGPGRYIVKVLVPSPVDLVTHTEDLISKPQATDALTILEYKVELGQSQCDYRQLDLFPVDPHATAQISGSVLTASGHPVNKGFVSLLKEDGSHDSSFSKIEPDGSFKFEDVAVGAYFLVLNPKNEAPSERDPPYARAFYPNATDASGATKIVVTEGLKLENLTLRVGPAWKARVVSGRVVGTDGNPVKFAYISLYDGDRYVRQVQADNKGRFSFDVYGDFKYKIRAEVMGQHAGQSDYVTITNKSTNLTLVLKPK